MPGHATFLEKTPASAARGARTPATAEHVRVSARPPASPAGAGAPSTPGGVGEVLALQRRVGNQAVMRMLDARRPVQALPDDDEVQRAAGGRGEPSDAAIHAAAGEGVRTPSSSLPFLGRIQASFGRHSVARVQAHTGPGATAASRAMDARAYASGDHVVFGGAPDLRTAAHEAAHVVQQRAGVQLAGGVGRAGDPWERHADAVADAVVAGRSAEAMLEPHAGPPSSPAQVQGGETQRSRPVQRKIGDGAPDESLVIHRESGRLYFARRNMDGTYTLVSAEGSDRVIVGADDDGYDLFSDQDGGGASDPPSQKRKRKGTKRFSIKSNQAKRRVFAEAFGEAGEKPGVLHKKARAEKTGKKKRRKKGNEEAEDKGDYAYADLAEAYHGAQGLDREMIDQSMAEGVLLPLEDGDVLLDPEKDEDLQMVPFLALMYQKFHTPPTLKSKGRKWENAWRDEELDFTRKALLLGPESVQSILPKLPKNRQASRLRDIYPGPIDVGIPPDPEQTLFRYNQNKAVYKLNKSMQLDAYRERSEVEDPEERDYRARMIGTRSYFKTIEEQEESTVEDPAAYIRATLGLKRSDSAESLDLASEDEGSGGQVPKEIYDPADDVETASRKRNTFLNTLGLTTKQVNRKLLQDRMDERLAPEASKQDPSDVERPPAPGKGLARHQAILDRLEKRHQQFLPRLQKPFEVIVKADTAYKGKKKLLAQYRPEGSDDEQWNEYNEKLEGYLERPVGELVKKWQPPLSKVGKKKLEETFGAPEKGEKRKKKARGKASGAKKGGSKDSGSSHDRAAAEWAARLGGKAMYGSSDGNNCLIFAIGFALGKPVPRSQASAIRQSLGDWNLMGVDQRGFLPAYHRVVEAIAQHLLSGEQLDPENAPPVQITIDSALTGIAPVVIGQGGGRDVRVFHDGVHFWWLKRG
ncbi:MAG: DUF4157 domain-containing protein [Longimicrobiaceae bacterium]